MEFKLISEMDIPSIKLGNSIVKPYLFVKSITHTDIHFTDYIVLFTHNEYAYWDDDVEYLHQLDEFLQNFLEMYLPNQSIGFVKIVQCFLKSGNNRVLVPFTCMKDMKYKKNALHHRILKFIEVCLQVLMRTREKELEKETRYCTTRAKIGYWKLSFKKGNPLSKELITDLISQIPQEKLRLEA